MTEIYASGTETTEYASIAKPWGEFATVKPDKGYTGAVTWNGYLMVRLESVDWHSKEVSIEDTVSVKIGELTIAKISASGSEYARSRSNSVCIPVKKEDQLSVSFESANPRQATVKLLFRDIE